MGTVHLHMQRIIKKKKRTFWIQTLPLCLLLSVKINEVAMQQLSVIWTAANEPVTLGNLQIQKMWLWWRARDWQWRATMLQAERSTKTLWTTLRKRYVSYIMTIGSMGTVASAIANWGSMSRHGRMRTKQ